MDVLSHSIDVQNIIGIELKQCTCKLQESTSILQECSSILLKSTSNLLSKYVKTTNKVHPNYEEGVQLFKFFNIKKLISKK